MIRNSIKNGCKNLYIHSKSFKITFKPNSYLMSICGRCPINPSTHTFCIIHVTQTMAYWCSQKVVAYYENIIRNLELVFLKKIILKHNLITLWMNFFVFLQVHMFILQYFLKIWSKYSSCLNGAILAEWHIKDQMSYPWYKANLFTSQLH